MSKEVLAAVDCSLAAGPVLATARALGEVLGAQATAIHVRQGRTQTPRSLSKAAGVPLRVVDGAVVERLVSAARSDAVAAVVIGAHSVPADPRPLGSTAIAIATTLVKPVVVVPPEAEPRQAIRRVLVPLEGDVATSDAPQSLIDLVPTVGLDVVALHVVLPNSIPAFTDQPCHEQEARAREFIARYCPWGLETVRLATRVGRREEHVPLAARELACDLIVLGWSQRLTPGRARVVRAALEGSGLPVMLFPVPASAKGEHPGGGSHKTLVDGGGGSHVGVDRTAA
jgi:nucleotide-binding universal stress UspA family protein